MSYNFVELVGFGAHPWPAWDDALGPAAGDHRVLDGGIANCLQLDDAIVGKIKER